MAFPWEEYQGATAVADKPKEVVPWEEYAPKQIEQPSSDEKGESVIPKVDDIDLPDESMPDLPKPTSEDLGKPQPSRYVPSVKPEDIPGTDLASGLKSIQTQIAGWATGMARGALQTVMGTPENVLATPLKTAMGPIVPLAEPMTRMFLKGIDKLIPGTRQEIIDAIPGLKYTDQLAQKLAQPTDIEKEAQKDFEQNSTEALQAYGLPMQIAYQVADTAWKIAGTVILAESVMGKGTAPQTHLGENVQVAQLSKYMKDATMKAASKFAAFVFGTTPGTPEEKSKAAAVAFAFSATPLVASGARTDGLAKLFTAAMNMGISAVSGSYNDTVEKAMAIAETKGEDWDKIGLAKQSVYWAASAIPQAVADLTMALGAKSVRSVERAMRDKTIAAVNKLMGNEVPKIETTIGETKPEVSGKSRKTIPTSFLRNPENLTEDFNVRQSGDLVGYGEGQPKGTWEDFKSDIQKNGIKNPIEIYVNKDGKIDVVEGTHRLLAAEELGIKEVPFKATGYTEKIIFPTGESSRQGTAATPEGVIQATTPATGVSDLQQSLAEAKTHDIANAVIDIASESTKHWNDMQKLYWQKIRDGEIESVKGSPKKTDIVQALKDNWQPEVPLAPVDVAKTESTMPGYMRRWGNAPKESVKRLEDHISKVKEVIDKSVLATQTKQGYTPKPEEIGVSTKASVLKDGLDKAINHLKTLEFAPEEFYETIDGITKGKNKIEGIGSSAGEILKLAWAAETPEQAISMINTARAERGTSIFTDIPTAVRGGAPIVKPPERIVKEADYNEMFNAMPSKLKSSENGPAAIKAAINSLPFDLPQNITARENIVRAVVRNAYEISKAMDGGRADRDWSWENAKGFLRLFESSRYWVNSIYKRTGDYKFYKNHSEIERVKANKEYENQVEFDRIMTERKVPDDVKFYLERFSNRKLHDAVADVIGLDPYNEKHQAILKKAHEVINADKRSEDIKKVIDAIHAQSQSSVAAEVRSIMIIKWSNFWKKYGQRIAEGEAGKGDELTLRNLQNKEKDLLPAYISEDGNIEHITREQAFEASRIYEEKGVQGLVDYEYGQTYGTRKYYWMQSYTPEESFKINLGDGYEVFNADRLLGQDVDLQAAPKISGATEQRIMPTINPKTGMNNLNKKGSIFGMWHKHTRDIKVQLWTYELMRELSSSLNEHIKNGDINPAEAELYGKKLLNDWGIGQKTPWPAKILLKLNSLFWKQHFLSVARLGWWSGRNIFQGSGFGQINTQYRVGDVQWAYPVFAARMTDKNSTIRNAFNTDFAQRINQSRSFINERMYLGGPGETVKAGRIMEAINELSGMSDTGARLLVYGPGYVIAEKYAGRLAEGKITQGQFENGLMFDSMVAGDQMLVRDMMMQSRDVNGKFTRAGLEPVIREIAKIKNANVNFLYGTTERSLIEQTAAWRPFVGLISFARGSLENIYHAGIEPWLEGMDMYAKTKDASYLKTTDLGFKVIVSSVLAYAVSSTVMSYLLGEKRDYKSVDVKKTKPGHGLIDSSRYVPFSPGISKSGEITMNLLDLADSFNILMTRDTDAFKKALNDRSTTLANNAIYMIPILADLGHLAKTTGNVAMTENVDAVKYWVHDVWKGIPPKGIDADRAWYESLQQLLFGTSEFGDDRKLLERLRDSSIYGELKQVGENERTEALRKRSRR